MAISDPIKKSFTAFLKETSSSCLFQSNNKNRLTTVIPILYQTNNASLSVINIPSTPVKPARNTEMCNLTKACFMRNCNIVTI